MIRENSEPRITLLYDVKLRRPACVLLQAVAGGDRSALHRFFDAKDWLVAPTHDMRMVTGTIDEWTRVAALAAPVAAKGKP